MDEQLKQELDWMNANLETIPENQALIYHLPEEIRDRLPEPEKAG